MIPSVPYIVIILALCLLVSTDHTSFKFSLITWGVIGFCAIWSYLKK